MVGFATVIKICSTPSQTVRAISKRLAKVRALLAMDDAGEAVVLALQEYTGVQEHGDEESRQALREAERRDGLCALSVGQINGPAIGLRWQFHRSSSSIMRGCADRPPRPPTDPPTTGSRSNAMR